MERLPSSSSKTVPVDASIFIARLYSACDLKINKYVPRYNIIVRKKCMYLKFNGCCREIILVHPNFDK